MARAECRASCPVRCASSTTGSAQRPCPAPCAPARPSSGAGWRRHAPARRSRRRPRPCHSSAPWRRRCRAPPPRASTSSSPSSSPIAISGERSSTYFPAKGFSITAIAAARRVGGETWRPISICVSSTTVTILRMIALMIVSSTASLFRHGPRSPAQAGAIVAVQYPWSR